MAMLLLEAGFETTVNLIGNGVALLTRHPDQLESCAPHRALAGSAADEVLRFDSAVPAHRPDGSPRLVEIAGERVRAGELVIADCSAARTATPPCSQTRSASTSPGPMPGGTWHSRPGIHYCVGGGAGEDGGRGRAARTVRPVPGPGAHHDPHRRPSPVLLRGYDTMPAVLSPVGARA